MERKRLCKRKYYNKRDLESSNDQFPVGPTHLSRPSILPEHAEESGHHAVDGGGEGGERETEEGEETVEGVGEDLGVAGGEGEGEEGEKGIQHLELLGRRTVEFSLLEGSTQNLVTEEMVTCTYPVMHTPKSDTPCLIHPYTKI